MNIFVTAIGTDSGKTLVSAILCKALNATYFKPIQSGSPTDRSTVGELLGADWPTLPEAVALQIPASPHYSAQAEGRHIAISRLEKPHVEQGHLVIEGAGGLLVPVNEKKTMADVAALMADGIVLVSNYYLGSINHTLLTIEAMKARNLPLIGIIFNGQPMPGSQEVITAMHSLPVLLEVPRLENVTTDALNKLAAAVQWPQPWASQLKKA